MVVAVVLVFLGILLPSSSQIHPCPPSYNRVDDNLSCFYKSDQSQTLDWTNAFKFCSEIKGRLYSPSKWTEWINLLEGESDTFWTGMIADKDLKVYNSLGKLVSKFIKDAPTNSNVFYPTIDNITTPISENKFALTANDTSLLPNQGEFRFICEFIGDVCPEDFVYIQGQCFRSYRKNNVNDLEPACTEDTFGLGKLMKAVPSSFGGLTTEIMESILETDHRIEAEDNDRYSGVCDGYMFGKYCHKVSTATISGLKTCDSEYGSTEIGEVLEDLDIHVAQTYMKQNDILEMKFWNTIPKPDPLYECQWAQGAFKADYTEDITLIEANTTSKCIRVCMSKKYYQRVLVAYDISQTEPENGDYSIDSCTCQYSISEEPYVTSKAYDQQEFASALLTTCSKSETAGVLPSSIPGAIMLQLDTEYKLRGCTESGMVCWNQINEIPALPNAACSNIDNDLTSLDFHGTTVYAFNVPDSCVGLRGKMYSMDLAAESPLWLEIDLPAAIH